MPYRSVCVFRLWWWWWWWAWLLFMACSARPATTWQWLHIRAQWPVLCASQQPLFGLLIFNFLVMQIVGNFINDAHSQCNQWDTNRGSSWTQKIVCVFARDDFVTIVAGRAWHFDAPLTHAWKNHPFSLQTLDTPPIFGRTIFCYLCLNRTAFFLNLISS